MPYIPPLSSLTGVPCLCLLCCEKEAHNKYVGVDMLEEFKDIGYVFFYYIYCGCLTLIFLSYKLKWSATDRAALIRYIILLI